MSDSPCQTKESGFDSHENTAMICSEEENAVQIATKTLDSSAALTPEKGRVLRRRNNTVTAQTDGPVLRATVKPVNRFIPEPNAVGISSAGPQYVPTNIKQRPNINVEGSSVAVESKPKRQHSSPQQSTSQPNAKKKRVREQWSIEDKNHFFDAVAIHGKDFDAIQKAIAQKHKKRGDETVIKTKEQVRHLYYRTWTTISKLLDHEAPTSSNTKGTQELFAVINYGELRKKLGGYLLKKKGILKLNELINAGSTSVRIKGKNFRIKTPSCKALKRIHDKEDAVKNSDITESRRIKLPLRVNLEMHPLTMKAWNYVHSLAHNPRIRFCVPLDCQLSYLLQYLTKKWRSLSEKMIEIAEYGHLRNDPFVPNSSSIQSERDDLLEFSFPPEVTIKAKVQVHQVVTSKTHCVVTYVTNKIGKQTGITARCKNNTTIVMSPSEMQQNSAVDSCASSEDEGPIADPLSDCEVPSVNICRETTGFSPVDDMMLNDQCNDEHDVAQEESEKVSNLSNSISIENLNNQKNYVSEHGAEILAEAVDENCCSAESADSNENNDSANLTKLLNTLNYDDSSGTGACLNDEITVNDDDTIAADKSTDNNTTTRIVRTNCSIALFNDKLKEGKSENAAVTSTESGSKLNDLQKCSSFKSVTCMEASSSDINLDVHFHGDNPPVFSGAVNDSAQVRAIKEPIQKSWNIQNVGDRTLAEVFLMLGKPSVFKLCYDIIKQCSKDAVPAEKSSDKSSQLSFGMKALCQAASLLHKKLNKTSPDEKTSSCNKEPVKTSVSLKKIKLNNNHIGVQCNMTDKQSMSSTGSSSASSQSAGKKTHGRGVSKFASIPAIGSSNGFAVPGMPIARRRKMPGFDAPSHDGDEEVRQQRIQVQLGDVRFRKQMEALNRRKDLFRPQNKSRTMRKPFIVQRKMMPHAGAVRKMMTLSIDSGSVNKVGYVPLLPLASPSRVGPEMECVGTARPSFTPTSGANQTSEQWNSSEDKFGEALGLKIQQQNDATSLPEGCSSGQNVLEVAAREAGLSSFEDPALEDSEFVTDEQPALAEFSSNVSDVTSIISTSYPIIHTNSDLGEIQSYGTSYIENDALLPVRSPTPSIDSISETFGITPSTSSSAKLILKDGTFPTQTLTLGQNENQEKCEPALSMPVLDILSTPQKSSPVHPWAINSNSRDGLGTFSTLNTPQRILLSDSEDSLDSSIFGSSKRQRLQEDNESIPYVPNFNDAEMDLQMQCLLSEDSVDFMSKFQDLIKQTPTSDSMESSVNEQSSIFTTEPTNNFEQKKGDG